MTLPLDTIRDCLEGTVPSAVATCAPDGTPNVTYVSQVYFVDSEHAALSHQFFNKTRENILRHPRAAAIVVHPVTGAQFRIELEYEHTEESGPLFERMKAKLAGIASHTGMAGVFRLLGSDVYRVLDISAVLAGPGPTIPPPRRNTVAALRTFTEALASAGDLETLLGRTLEGLESSLGIPNAMILVAETSARKLYTVASRGYPRSGVGSEIPFGCGVIGVAAEQKVPIRISHMAAEYAYSQAVRESALREGITPDLETAIPFPGLAESRSQVAVPIVAIGQLVGVLFAESPEDLRFGYDDEDALAAIAFQLGSAMKAIEGVGEGHGPVASGGRPAAVATGKGIRVRHYPEDDSIFIDDDYLIKGVAGAIFSSLLGAYSSSRRQEFSNKELRLDPSLRLPDVTDNLEARLILLERRLVERNAPMRIEKTGRGRFRLRVDGPFELVAVGA